MYHMQPTSRVEREDIGLIDSTYNFKDLKELSLNIITIPGGSASIKASKQERLIIGRKGLGVAIIDGKYHQLREDVVLEVRRGTDVTFTEDSQVEFYLVESR
ncbi:hypothetical protein IMZ31_20870 (plasmid) [Pontibacillus sp. ALD_SL1]|uniref:hypothetical protein n=1 Tax=Pontibacillus sp. ALD_SL1 TaxID=2777185 RepID=UPI001A957066|nr:hypothetical protein [Pontibacillus sp. ALD_SL1]QST03003.1 hypothetical protein IMZ31_20870 [Pontibacillus sp. ALD_SL1]